jgi:hypothetical protein
VGSGSMFRATGTSDVSQAAADTQTLTALNGQRKHRYAGTGGYGGLADRLSTLSENPSLPFTSDMQ